MTQKQFFADVDKPGLTASKAQRLCTWAAKAMLRAEAKTKRINFVNVSVETFGNIEKPLPTEIGDEQYKFDDEIKEMIELTSLMSYLHEAIRYKEDLNNKIDSFNLEDYCEHADIEYPRMPVQKTPEEAINSWEPEKVARYYHLQNVTSILHKLVGQTAPYEKAIKRLLEIKKVPREELWREDKLYVKVYTPSVDSDKAIATFNKYQRMHDDAQSELNGMRYELEQLNDAAVVKARDEYTKALQEYKVRRAELQVQFETWKEAEKEKVRKLRIRIPDNLMTVFNKVRSLGKDTIEMDNE